MVKSKAPRRRSTVSKVPLVVWKSAAKDLEIETKLNIIRTASLKSASNDLLKIIADFDTAMSKLNSKR